MITVEKLESLDGSVAIPTKDIITFDILTGNLVTGDGKVVTATGTGSSGGTGGTGGTGGDTGGTGGTGGGTVTTEVEDTLLTILPAAIDSAQDNIYKVSQETNQPGWSKIQPIIYQTEFSLESTGGGSMMLSKIDFAVRSAGYQMIKILLFNANSATPTTPISFGRLSLNSVKLGSDATKTVSITSNGFMLVDNATYELANILSTDKMPVAGTSAWYSLTANTDATAKFSAVFSSPIEVTSARIYRCGASTASFNGGSEPYDVVFTDNNAATKSIEVPKVSEALFTGITAYTTAALESSGVAVTAESKKYNFTFSYSLNGTNYTLATPISQVAEQNATSGLWTYKNTYAPIIITGTTQKDFYIKIPDTNIANLKNVQVKQWYLQ